jgi:hypothetical protein
MPIVHQLGCPVGESAVAHLVSSRIRADVERDRASAVVSARPLASRIFFDGHGYNDERLHSACGNEVSQRLSRDHAVLEVDENQSRLCDLPYFARADGDVLNGRPPLAQEGEPALAHSERSSAL